jgi:hypothetical protein
LKNIGTIGTFPVSLVICNTHAIIPQNKSKKIIEQIGIQSGHLGFGTAPTESIVTLPS